MNTHTHTHTHTHEHAYTYMNTHTYFMFAEKSWPLLVLLPHTANMELYALDKTHT